MRNESNTVIVTGASQGIAAGLVRAFLEGCRFCVRIVPGYIRSRSDLLEADIRCREPAAGSADRARSNL
jgi:NAD(P)-dependent dehydrogenase (short-subunit alcohol dehydrogenase family)